MTIKITKVEHFRGFDEYSGKVVDKTRITLSNGEVCVFVDYGIEDDSFIKE